MTGSIDTFCRAPFVSLYLDQFGNAKACCQHYPSAALGNIKHQRLREIWDGPRAQELRQAVSVGDLSRGCGFCNWERSNEVDPGFPANFEFAPADAHPRFPVQLELALSSACNLQCVMCDGYFSSSIRIHREKRPPLPDVYPESFYEDLKEFGPHLQRVMVFGGEPFLAGPSLRALEVIAAVNPSVLVNMTTNATIWNSRVESLVDSLNPEIVVSLDGISSSTFEQIRIGASLDQVLTNIDRFRERCSNVSLTHCLMTNNWHEFSELLRFATERDLNVGVNTVLRPAELSLFHLPQNELRDIVDTMERQGPTDLGRNQPVWDEQVATLQRAARTGWEGSTNSPWSETTVQLQPKPSPGSFVLMRGHDGWSRSDSSSFGAEESTHPLGYWMEFWVGRAAPELGHARRSRQSLDSWLVSVDDVDSFVATFSDDDRSCEFSAVQPSDHGRDSHWLTDLVPTSRLDASQVERIEAGLRSEGAARLVVIHRDADGTVLGVTGEVDLLGVPIGPMVGTRPISGGELVSISALEPSGRSDLREMRVALSHAPDEAVRLIDTSSAWFLASSNESGQSNPPLLP